MVTMAFPYALENIKWKTYMINGAWGVLQVIYVVIFWVETKGKSLEEIDQLFDGFKHSDGPDISEAMHGRPTHLALSGVEVHQTETEQDTVQMKGKSTEDLN
jgi:hypothetical protein